MRVAAVYDIHGNLPALEAVLHEIREAAVDLIVIGGDVLPGPMPDEALDRLARIEIPAVCILGNGEREVLAVLDGAESTGVPEAYRPVMHWVAQRLQPEHVRWITAWPPTATVNVTGLGEVHFCHATPRSDTEVFTSLTPDARLLPAFAGVSSPLIVCGHTHMQFDRRVGALRIINAGSVGMPFGPPGAYWLVLEAGMVALRHTAYDLSAAAERVRATDYPQAADFAANNILNPPSEERMLDVFTRASQA